jgi:hypothetical protein
MTPFDPTESRPVRVRFPSRQSPISRNMRREDAVYPAYPRRQQSDFAGEPHPYGVRLWLVRLLTVGQYPWIMSSANHKKPLH